MPLVFLRSPVSARLQNYDIESKSTLISFFDVDAFGAYERSELAVWMASGGICLSVIFSIACISLGIHISLHKNTIGDVVLPPKWSDSNFAPVHKSMQA